MTIQFSAQTRIFICMEPLDFHNGFDGTAAACRIWLKQNPLDGGLFAFTNKAKTMVRLYLFDGHGELMITKRVAVGRFRWWKAGGVPEEVVVEHLHLLLRGGDPQSVRFPSPWKRIECD